MTPHIGYILTHPILMDAATLFFIIFYHGKAIIAREILSPMHKCKKGEKTLPNGVPAAEKHTGPTWTFFGRDSQRDLSDNIMRASKPIDFFIKGDTFILIFFAAGSK